MALILNIDTAMERACISIAKNGKLLGEKTSADQQGHASFLQPAVQALCTDTGIGFDALDAVAVSAGPGSYTGLRVGMASAKGLCYALKKPLIVIGSLEILAASAIAETTVPDALFCPMIDARRMEVFTAIYDAQLNPVAPASALLLDENSFSDLLSGNVILFTGNGAAKWQKCCGNPNARFPVIKNYSHAMAALAFSKFDAREFASLIKAEPFYIKDFFGT
jgi:tRNA threonylcarbamoyladenosine biosynthesis protein TsaB